MATNNTVTLVGNITAEPNLQFTPSGAANCKFGIAVSRKWQNRQTQEWNEETSFFNVVLWGQMAENAIESLVKGTRVVITGRIDVRQYEKQDGTKGTSVDVVADEIGPSIRFATAEVVRNERSDGSGGGSSNNGGGSGTGGGGRPSAPAAVTTPAYDEEPFAEDPF